MPKLKKAFGDAGIAIEDSNGELRSTYDVLEDLAGKWDTLSSKQQQYLGEKVAGNRQVKVLNAIMKNWDVVEDTIEKANTAQGAATEGNEKYLNSIQGKITAFQSAFQNLSRTTVNSDAVKGIIDIGTGLANVTTKAGGLVPVLSTVSGLLLTFKGNKISDGINNIKTAFQGITAGLAGSGGLAGALTGVTGLLGGALAVGGLIAGGVSLLNQIPSKVETLNADADEKQQKYIEAQDNLSSLDSQLENTKQLISNLQSKDTLTVVEQGQYEQLKAQNAELERQIALENEKVRVTQKEARESAALAMKTRNESTAEGGIFNTPYTAPDKLVETLGQRYFRKNAKSIDQMLGDQGGYQTGTAFNLTYGQLVDAYTAALPEQKRRLQKAIEDRNKLVEAGITDPNNEVLKRAQDNIEKWQGYTNDSETFLYDYLDYLNQRTAGLSQVENALPGSLDEYHNKMLDLRDSLTDQLVMSSMMDKSVPEQSDYMLAKYADQVDQLKELYKSAGEISGKDLEAPDFAKMLADFTQLGWESGDVVKHLNEIFASGVEIKNQTSALDDIISGGFKATEAYKTLTAAMTEQQKQGTISLDTYKSMMENADLAKYFNSTADALSLSANGLVLNTNALNDYIKAQQESSRLNALEEIMKQQKALDELNQKYNDGAINAAQYNKEAGAIQNDIDALSAYVREIENANGALSRYSAAKQTANQDAEYNVGQSAFKDFKEGRKSGKIGTDDFKEATNFLLGDDWEKRFNGDVEAAYKQANKIGEKYFGENEKKGATNFAKELAKIRTDKNGNAFQFANFNEATGELEMLTHAVQNANGELEQVPYTMDEIASSLGISTDAASSLFGLLETYGANFEWPEVISKDDQATIEQRRKDIEETGKAIEDVDKKIADVNKQIQESTGDTTALEKQRNALEQTKQGLENYKNELETGTTPDASKMSLEEAQVQIQQMSELISAMGEQGIEIPVSFRLQLDSLLGLFPGLANQFPELFTGKNGGNQNKPETPEKTEAQKKKDKEFESNLGHNQPKTKDETKAEFKARQDQEYFDKTQPKAKDTLKPISEASKKFADRQKQDAEYFEKGLPKADETLQPLSNAVQKFAERQKQDAESFEKSLSKANPDSGLKPLSEATQKFHDRQKEDAESLEKLSNQPINVKQSETPLSPGEQKPNVFNQPVAETPEPITQPVELKTENPEQLKQDIQNAMDDNPPVAPITSKLENPNEIPQQVQNAADNNEVGITFSDPSKEATGVVDKVQDVVDNKPIDMIPLDLTRKDLSNALKLQGELNQASMAAFPAGSDGWAEAFNARGNLFDQYTALENAFTKYQEAKQNGDQTTLDNALNNLQTRINGFNDAYEQVASMMDNPPQPTEPIKYNTESLNADTPTQQVQEAANDNPIQVSFDQLGSKEMESISSQVSSFEGLGVSSAPLASSVEQLSSAYNDLSTSYGNYQNALKAGDGKAIETTGQQLQTAIDGYNQAYASLVSTVNGQTMGQANVDLVATDSSAPVQEVQESAESSPIEMSFEAPSSGVIEGMGESSVTVGVTADTSSMTSEIQSAGEGTEVTVPVTPEVDAGGLTVPVTPEVESVEGIDVGSVDMPVNPVLSGDLPGDESRTLTYNISTSGSLPGNETRTLTYNIVVNGSVPGHAKGTSNAKPGPSLVDEEGRELIEHKSQGTFELGTDKGPRFTNLERGDVVHTAKETEKILSRLGRVGGFFRDGFNQAKSFFGGAFASGISGGGKTTLGSGSSSSSSSKKKTSSSSSKSSSTKYDDSSWAYWWNSSFSSSKKEKDPLSKVKTIETWAKKLFDWAEIKLDRLQHATDQWMSSAAQAIGFSARNNELENAFASVREQIEANTDSVSLYLEQAALVAEKANLPDDIVDQIKDGTIEIDEYSEKVQKVIKEYQKWYDKATKCSDALDELKKQEKEIATDMLDNIIDHYDYRIDRLDSVVKQQEAIQKLSAASGKEEYGEDYTKSIQATTDKLEVLVTQRNELNGKFQELIERGLIEADSEEWFKYKGELEDIDEEITNTKISIIDLQDTVNKINLTKLGYQLDQLSNSASHMNEMIDLHKAQANYEADSTYYNLIQNGMEQIKNLEKQNEEYRRQQQGLDVLSEKYQDLEKEIQSNITAINQMKSSQEGWNDAVVDTQISKIEKYKDTLSKTNDQYKRQKELQEAIEELERARTQRNQRVFHENVGFVYEADQDAVREAQDNLENVITDQLMAKMDDLIDALGEVKDNSNVYDANGILLGSVYNTPQIDNLSTVLSDYYHNSNDSAIISGLRDMLFDKVIAETGNNISSKNIELSIGDIIVNEAQNGSELAQTIVDQFSSSLLQALYKK